MWPRLEAQVLSVTRDLAGEHMELSVMMGDHRDWMHTSSRERGAYDKFIPGEKAWLVLTTEQTDDGCRAFLSRFSRTTRSRATVGGKQVW